MILYGSGGEPVRDRARGRAAAVRDQQAVRGRGPQHAAALARDRQRLDARGAVALQSSTTCEACGGYRLKPEALAVKIAGRHIGEVTELSIARRGATGSPGCRRQLTAEAAGDRRAHPQGDPRAAGLPRQGRAGLSDAGARLRHAVGRREPAHPAGLADRLGADRRALRAGRALDRPAPARQRPAAGDAEALRDLGNTVIVVEHDEDAIRTADHADRHGAGRRRAWRRCRRRGHARRGHGGARQSLTGQYLSGVRAIAVPAMRRRKPKNRRWLELIGARANNLQDVDGRLPARHVRLRHRRVGRRQVEAGGRHALSGAGAGG